MLWELVQERDALRRQCDSFLSQVEELGRATSSEIEEWVRLTDAMKEELERMKIDKGTKQKMKGMQEDREHSRRDGKGEHVDFSGSREDDNRGRRSKDEPNGARRRGNGEEQDRPVREYATSFSSDSTPRGIEKERKRLEDRHRRWMSSPLRKDGPKDWKADEIDSEREYLDYSHHSS